MKPIHEVLNKIIWTEDPAPYTLGVYDRITDTIVRIPLIEMTKLEKNFLIIQTEGKTREIPLHRVRIVWKNNDILWQR